MRLLGFLEILIILAVLWIVLNIIHAVATGKSKEIESGFFWLSRKIKGELNEEEKK